MVDAFANQAVKFFARQPGEGQLLRAKEQVPSGQMVNHIGTHEKPCQKRQITPHQNVHSKCASE